MSNYSFVQEDSKVVNQLRLPADTQICLDSCHAKQTCDIITTALTSLRFKRSTQEIGNLNPRLF